MIINFDDLAGIRKKYQDKKIVLGSGVFDLIHRGHVEYISQLRKYGDIVVVLVKPDARVRKGKGESRPIIPESDRVAIINSLKGVDFAFVGPHLSFKKEKDLMYDAVLSTLQPDVFYSTNPVWKKLEEYKDVKIIIGKRLSSSHLDSTTAIIEHIRKSNV